MHPSPVPPHPYGSYGVGGYGGGGGEPGQPPLAGGGVGGSGGGGVPPPWGGGIPPPPTRFDDMAAMPVSELEVRPSGGVRRGGAGAGEWGGGGRRERLRARGGCWEEHAGGGGWVTTGGLSLVCVGGGGEGGIVPPLWWPWLAPGRARHTRPQVALCREAASGWRRWGAAAGVASEGPAHCRQDAGAPGDCCSSSDALVGGDGVDGAAGWPRWCFSFSFFFLLPRYRPS